MKAEIEKARLDADSVGGIIECAVTGVKAGFGEPITILDVTTHRMPHIGCMNTNLILTARFEFELHQATIFTGNLHGYLDEDALELVKDGTHMFNFTNPRMTETSEESKALNMDPTPKVIISASGMCDAGRIRHHLKHNLWRPECTVVFVGYQGEGTLGRSLLEGTESVKLFGEEIAVHAKIVNFQGLSSHADRDHLLAWIKGFQAPKPQHVFVVHGDREVAPYFAQSVAALGFQTHAPQYTEAYTFTRLSLKYSDSGTSVSPSCLVRA